MPPRKAKAQLAEKHPQELTVIPAEPSVGLMIMDAAKNGASPEALEKLVDLKLKVDANDALKSHGRATALFQSKVGTVVKDKKVDIATKSGKRMSYGFTSFEFLVHTIQPLLDECGLSFSFDTKQDEAGKITTLYTDISHVDGHTKRSQVPAMVDPKAYVGDQQKLGIAMTYAKRQGLSLALGIRFGERDNDAVFDDPKDADTVNDEQSATIAALLDELSTSRQADFMKYMKVEAVEQIVKRDYKKAVHALNAARMG